MMKDTSSYITTYIKVLITEVEVVVVVGTPDKLFKI